MNDKKIVEAYKTARSIERAQPDASLQIAARNDLIRMLDREWAETRSKPKVGDDAERLRQLRTIIDNETNPVKKEIHERLYGIADRMSHRSKQRTGEASEIKSVSNEPLPLHNFLRKRF